jgi:hypothetical protein
MIRDIKIKAVLNGFIIECGCQTLVCEDVDRLTKSINAYFKNPEVVEKEWINTSINSKHTSPQVCVELPTVGPRTEANQPIGRLNANRPTQRGLVENALFSGGGAEESRLR